jgi:serine protease Do
VIIDRSGIILTNDHVVDGADEVLVELSDGRQFKASDIKLDPQSDLAVLRIKAGEPLPAATLGDSDALDIGDWVLAVGNPFDLDLTVSAGIISSKGRVLPSSKRASFLQTDAAINPGNSGGPLVNLDGEVVGINTAIASSTGVYEGIGFAIPVNLAKWVAGQLIEKGAVQRAYLGVSIGELTSRMAERLGIERARGVLVSEVFPGSPAAAAGVREGDVIVAYAGKPVANPRQLQEIVERSASDSKEQLEVIRDGKPKTLSVVVKPLPSDFAAAERGRRPGAPPRKEPAGFDAGELGLQVDELNDEAARRLGIEAGAGVVVSSVDPNGLAAQIGLREGMAILRVGRKPVKSVADFKAALQGESVQQGIMLLVRTAEGNRFVVLQKD